MAAPQAVQQQAERAEELRKSIYESTPEEGAIEEQETSPTETIEQAATPETESAKANEDPGHVEAPIESSEEQYRKLKAAYDTLQGKYKAEVPRLQEQLCIAEARATQAENKASELESTSRQESNVDVSDLADALTHELGEDAARVVQEFATKLVSSTVNQAKTQLKQESKQDRESNFWATVRNNVPDFDAINVNPEFIQWLQEPNPNTGLPIQDDLNRAGATLDAISVVKIFTEFKQRNAKAAPPPTATTQQDHVEPVKAPVQRSVETSPSYTAQDYQRLQEEIRRGKWIGREGEAQALEREILEAISA